jgi:hypothetical protein
VGSNPIDWGESGDLAAAGGAAQTVTNPQVAHEQAQQTKRKLPRVGYDKAPK